MVLLTLWAGDGSIDLKFVVALLEVHSREATDSSPLSPPIVVLRRRADIVVLGQSVQLERGD